jgi:heptosyltransferase-2
VQRILVIRLSALGDILLTTPILQLLRTACPQARLDVLLKTPYQDLLSAHPAVHRVLAFDSQQTLRHTLSALRRTSYDVALDLHRTLRSYLLLQGVRARYKLAYNKRTVRRALLVCLGWNTLQAMTPVPHLYAAPLRRLGITAPVPPLEMHLAPGSQAAMRSYVAAHLPDQAQAPLLALAPGAHWPTKRWPVERLAAVAQDMMQRQRAAVVILGAAEDKPLAQALGQRLQGPVLDSTGHLSLMHSAALLSQCRLLISHDSGLMHLAVALQIPVLAIFGPTVQEFGFYPFQARAQVLSTSLACRPCSTKGSRRCPRGHHACMQQITVPQVLVAARQLWDAQRRQDD